MKVHADISLVCFYECSIWSYLQVSYILLREAYIANTRNDTSGTSGDWQVQQLHSSSHTSDVENLPLPHMHTHTRAAMPCQWDFFLRSYDTQNCSLVARPLFSLSSLSVHTVRNKMQSESRAISTLHKLKGSIINRTILMFYCYVTQIKNSDLELSEVACRKNEHQTLSSWSSGWSSLSALLPHIKYTELKQREWKQISHA